MAPGVLRQALSQKPFRPIRVLTGDGNSFEIKSHEFCILSPKGRTLAVFTGKGNPSGDDEEMQLVDVFLITRLETEGKDGSFHFSKEARDEPG